MAKVLVVDDRPLNRELLRTLLQYQAHEVIEAGEGAEALAVARVQSPDLIITDILMPNMDGYEFVRQLRADAQLADTRVIFYTASYKTKEAHEMARQCRVEHLLFKPCEPEQILETVSRALATAVTKGADSPPPSSRAQLSELANTSLRLTAVTELCLDLSVEREPTVLLDKFCHSARELVKAQSALLLLHQDHPVCFVSNGELPPGDPQGWIQGLPALFAGHEALHSKQPGPEFAELPRPEDLGPLRNLLGVRLRSHQETYGWLCCFNKAGGFDDQDQHLLLTLAAQVGQTYENAVMFARLEQQAQELQRKNQALEARDELLRNLTRQVPGMLYQHHTSPDGQGSMTYVSEGVRRLFGLTPEQIRVNSTLLRERIHSEDRPAFDAWINEAHKAQDPSQISYRVCVPGEAEKWVHSEAVTERMPDGSLLWHGYVVDITEQRRLEASLIASEERLRLAKEIAGIGIWERDLISGKSFFDERMYALYQLAPDEPDPFTTATAKIHPDDREGSQAIFAAALQSLQPVTTTARLLLADGEIRYIEGRAQVFANAEGVPQRMIGMIQDITARQRAELELQRSRERMQMAQTSIGMGVWELDLVSGQMEIDAQMRQLVGLTPDEPIDQNSTLKHLHPDDRPMLQTYRQRLLSDSGLESPGYINSRVVRPDGEIRHIEGYSQVFRGPMGARLIGSTRDITERMQTQLALQHSRERMQMAQLSIGMGVWEFDFERGKLLLDAQMQQLVGVDAQQTELSPTEFLHYVHPDDREVLIRRQQQTGSGDTGSGYVHYRVVRPDGEIRYLESFSHTFRPADGNGIRLIGSTRDVTERKLAQDALAQSEERLRLAQAATGMGVWEIDLLTGQTSFDDQLCRLMGMTPGRDNQDAEVMLARLHPDDRAEAEAMIESAIRGESETACSTFRVIHPDGQIHHLEGQARVFAAPDGSFRRLIGSTRDVTERKLAEAELAASHDQLELMIQELRRMAIRAEAANLAKSEFLNNMSHELRTPLNGVLGGVQLLKHSALSKEQQGFAELIQRSGKSLLDLIDDVLNFANIEDHLLELEQAPFSLSELIAGVSARIQPGLAGKGLRFESQLTAGLPDRLIGDGLRLGQALGHLLENAVKFTPSGEIRLSVSSPEPGSDPLQLRFEISDTGIGIAPEQLEHIFTPFAQADSSLTRRYGGTGIGLSLASQLVGLMGGKIECQSEAGKGASFSFTILFALPEAAAPSPPEPQPVARAQETGPRILLVEDNPINQAVTAAILKKLGYAVEIAGDGGEALTALRARPFDLVLMDCQMPMLDGYEATGRIRAGEGGASSIPIVAVTAHVSEADRQRCLAAGMNDYLPKPFSLAELSEMLQRWLTARSEA